MNKVPGNTFKTTKLTTQTKFFEKQGFEENDDKNLQEVLYVE